MGMKGFVVGWLLFIIAFTVFVIWDIQPDKKSRAYYEGYKDGCSWMVKQMEVRP